jgi:hypothetical protein
MNRHHHRKKANEQLQGRQHTAGKPTPNWGASLAEEYGKRKTRFAEKCRFLADVLYCGNRKHHKLFPGTPSINSRRLVVLFLSLFVFHRLEVGLSKFRRPLAQQREFILVMR